ncbi:hypothetical protein RRG08_033570 [Elysia crispata]|uniref:Uncharacterized protein n=1 Tax=Elysia crispata TaxID=231223 RepID=A0AAE0XPG2_9GAST|nr:hypothetical protein RRG08_033570 [Elysia crispata]
MGNQRATTQQLLAPVAETELGKENVKNNALICPAHQKQMECENVPAHLNSVPDVQTGSRGFTRLEVSELRAEIFRKSLQHKPRYRTVSAASTETALDVILCTPRKPIRLE